MSTLSRRTFAQVSAGSLMIGGLTLPASAQTPDGTPELESDATLLDRLDAVDPQTTLDLLMASPFELSTIIPLAELAGIEPQVVEFGE